MNKVPKATWVEIESIVLQPEERSKALPEDTKRVPYVLHVSGFLCEDAEIGETTRIRTIIGRELKGKLITINPSYAHSFGKVVQELLTIGTEAEK